MNLEDFIEKSLIIRAAFLAGKLDAEHIITMNNWDDLINEVLLYVTWFINETDSQKQFLEKFSKKLINRFPVKKQ